MDPAAGPDVAHQAGEGREVEDVAEAFPIGLQQDRERPVPRRHGQQVGRPLAETGATISVTEHGELFAAAVERGMVAATQFHPEKSGDAGAAVLSNWLATL